MYSLSQIMPKLPGLVTALCLYYALPLAWNIFLILNPYVGIAMIVCSIVYLSQPAASKDQLKRPEDRNSMLFLVIATIISQESIIVEWAYWNTNHHFEWDIYVCLGLGLISVGLLIRLWAIHQLKDFFSNVVRLTADHQLIQDGLYAIVRHPAYTGAFLVALGIALFFHAWFSIVVSFMVLGCAYHYRIRQEERVLVERFGKDFENYQEKTSKMFPLWSLILLLVIICIAFIFNKF